MRALMIEGKDAADFLHRVTAGTVKGLEPGEGAGGVLLNGQSRMIAQFDLLRVGPEAFLAVSPPECFVALVNGLEGLLFAEDLKMEPVALPVGVFPVRQHGDRKSVFAFEGGFPSLVWPAAVPGYALMLGAGGPDLPDSFHFDRIGAGVPWPTTDWDDTTPALEAGVLPWIDRQKGCYPGQEVVERSINVGHPARVLQSVEGAKLPENLSPVRLLSYAVQAGVVRALLRAPWNQRAQAPEGFKLLHTWAAEEAN